MGAGNCPSPIIFFLMALFSFLSPKQLDFINFLEIYIYK